MLASLTPTRRFYAVLALITIAGFGLRVYYVLAHHYLEAPRIVDVQADTGCGANARVLEQVNPDQELFGDALYYHWAANLLADGDGFIEPYRYYLGGCQEFLVYGDDGASTAAFTTIPVGHIEPTAGHPPLYAMYLAAFSLLGFDSAFSHQIASCLLGALCIWFTGLAGRTLWNDRVGLIAAAGAASYVFIWINDAAIMSESIVLAVVAAISWLALRWWKEPTRANLIWLSVAGAAGVLSRAELLMYLPIVLGVHALVTRPGWKAFAGRVALAGVIGATLVGPWVLRNMTTFEEPVTVSNGLGTAMVQANCDDVYYGDKLGYWSLRCGEGQPMGPNGELLDESQRDVVVRERAIDYISNHKRRLVTFILWARIGRAWGIYAPFENIESDIFVEYREYTLSKIGLFQYWSMLPFAAVGVVLTRRRRLPLTPLLIWPGLTTFAAALTFGNTRYRVAAEVTVVLLAAVGADRLLERLGRPAPGPAHVDAMPDSPTPSDTAPDPVPVGASA